MNQIGRLRAEANLAQIHILASVGTGEAFQAAVNSLQEETGQIYVWEEEIPAELRVDEETGLDPEFDREALRALKARHSAG